MISAALHRGPAGYTGYEARGHSSQGEKGTDIVCAAVSILSATCVNALESVCGIVPVVTENDDGVLAFHLPKMTEEENGKAQILLGALRQGLSDLAAEYPKDVKLTIKKNGGKNHDEAQSAAIRS